MPKVIAPAALVALKDALSCVYWYKSDLRSFLASTISPELLAALNWQDYKRNIAAHVVDYMAKRQERYQRELLRLLSAVASVRDFAHLERLEGGSEKAAVARRSVEALRLHTAGHDALAEEEKQAEERRQSAHDARLKVTAVREKLQLLNQEYLGLVVDPNSQQRGYRLEKLLRGLFELFDLDPRASFKIIGEQIDGAFTFEGTDYLFEGKWQQALVAAADLDVFAAKLARKLDNTLGLFLSINGFSDDGVRAHSSGRRFMILMDGSDLMAILEGRIDLVQLLLRKRREASQSGNIYLRIHEIL